VKVALGSTRAEPLPRARLGERRTSWLANAVAADFDGNGQSDIAFSEGQKWRYRRMSYKAVSQ
jgi:hypothetical protein